MEQDLATRRRKAREAYDHVTHPESIIFVDPEHERILLDELRQEDRDKAFCWGMLAGGAVACAVLMLTLRLLGVL